jgi:hypothetical protein
MTDQQLDPTPTNSSDPTPSPGPGKPNNRHVQPRKLPPPFERPLPELLNQPATCAPLRACIAALDAAAIAENNRPDNPTVST